MNTEWHADPAVTTGGKPFFWTRYTPAGRKLTVVWDRVVLAYAAKVDDKTIAFCTAPESAREFLDGRGEA